MPEPIVDQVVDFHSVLFERIFTEPFRPRIPDRLRRNAVDRQIEESADAASQSLSRFFLNQQLAPKEVEDLLEGLQALGDLLDLERVSNSNVTPESVTEELLEALPLPESVRLAGNDAICRVALHSIVQVLMLVGPVMAEWQKLSFSSTFELPRRVVNRLNQISEQLDLLGRVGESVADERYELTYRDYLLQRFHRVEAGTVRMTTNLAVDLRELFVMPRVQERPSAGGTEGAGATAVHELMDLAAARELFQNVPDGSRPSPNAKDLSALDQAKKTERLVLIGTPGSGKSTFLEWLQLKLASVEEELILAEQQAIPLLLRVRQLDLSDLPQGAALVEKATASHDRASLMPSGWIERQMQKGRVFFLLDGLDETEPELRDRYLIPWLQGLCSRYPACHYLVSSRPVGYPPGSLRELGFVECDLLDFGQPEIAEYTQHWCTAVRLARNEPEAEARTEGVKDGGEIVDSFKAHAYIRHLAQNPLMLSAICLVNYFESGKLPEDRAVLYRLCVEGLLQHWDQRRGIRSEFTLEEKLRTCRNVALMMQSQDQAEYPSSEVEKAFGETLGDLARGQQLLEHIRFRAGLLLERRAGIFAFTHLTFQEYLAACAVYEGNQLGMDYRRLAAEHADGRWKEVIALYCGLSTDEAAREMLEHLLAQPSTEDLAAVLTEAYLSTKPDVLQSGELREKVIKRVAMLPGRYSELGRFPRQEVAPIANRILGTADFPDPGALSEAYYWLLRNPECIDFHELSQKLRTWRDTSPNPLAELLYVMHAFGPEEILDLFTDEYQNGLYSLPGPCFRGESYGPQAAIVVMALARRSASPTTDLLFSMALQVLSVQGVGMLVLKEFIIREIVFEHPSIFRFPSSNDWRTSWAGLISDIAATERRKAGTTSYVAAELFQGIDLLKNWATALKDNIREDVSRDE